MKRPCAYCSRVITIYARGLCGKCYYRPEIRAKFKANSVYGKRSICTGDSRTPQVHTDTPPGTDRRIAELIRRVERGESVHHPGDAWEITEESIRDAKQRKIEDRLNSIPKGKRNDQIQQEQAVRPDRSIP